MINEGPLLTLVSALSQPATPVVFERTNAQTKDPCVHPAYALVHNVSTMIAEWIILREKHVARPQERND